MERPQGHYFIVTGSNNQLLSGELSSTLTGRHFTIELFPFDFDEFHKSRNVNSVDLEKFLDQGGFPGLLDFPEPKKLLQQYFYDILEKDIRERIGSKSIRPLLCIASVGIGHLAF